MISPIILYATPCFLILIGLELIAERVKNTDYYRVNDTFGSLALGITSRSSRLVKLSLGAMITTQVLANWRLTEWSADNPLTWIATFILYDLTYYCFHRTAHTMNFFWAGHVIHHSSEEYNLSTALRQTSTSIFEWIFSLPLLLIGAPLEVYSACVALNLVYQFWVHTRHIKRLGFLEWFMVTPSHHRVHHAQNAIYIDRNHGGVFILWDRLFGTFQKELADEPPIFGVRRPLHRINPISANVQVWMSLIRDAWYTERWWDKFRIWFMPTGWRPSDVEQSMPIEKTDLSHFHKYDPVSSWRVKTFTIFQILAAFPAGVYLLKMAPELSYLMVVLYWVLVTAPLVTCSLMLEGKLLGLFLEYGRLLASWGAFVFLGVGLDPMVWWSVLIYLMTNSIFLLLIGKVQGVEQGEAVLSDSSALPSS